MCTNAQCGIFVNEKNKHTKSTQQPMSNKRATAKQSGVGVDPWAWLKALLLAVAEHKPDFDLDDDLFAADPVLRGYNWRGADCDNFDASVYPGRKKGAAGGDFDCNGISGIDPTTQQPYEQELCAGVGRLGVVVVGDSAGAHFSIPVGRAVVTTLVSVGAETPCRPRSRRT